MQPIPKLVAATRVKILRQFHRQRPMAGSGQVFPQLLPVWREYMDAAPTARNRDVPLLRIGRGFDG